MDGAQRIYTAAENLKPQHVNSTKSANSHLNNTTIADSKSKSTSSSGNGYDGGRDRGLGGYYEAGALFARGEELTHAIMVTKECLKGWKTMVLTCCAELDEASQSKEGWQETEGDKGKPGRGTTLEIIPKALSAMQKYVGF